MRIKMKCIQGVRLGHVEDQIAALDADTLHIRFLPLDFPARCGEDFGVMRR